MNEPPPTRTSRRRAAVLLGVGSVALFAFGGIALSSAAYAAFVDVPVTGTPGRLVLSSDPYPAQFLELSPGQPEYWQVAARLEDAQRATLALQLQKDGALVEHPRGLVMGVSICPIPWSDTPTAPVCGAGARPVTVASPSDDYEVVSPVFDVEPLVAGEPQYVLVTLSVEDTAAAAADESLMGLVGEMSVGLTAVAFDDVVTPRARDGLPTTGADPSFAFATVAMAAGMLGLGFALRLRRRGAEL